MLRVVLIALFSVLASVHALPCSRLYVQGLDSTTTDYPQLAGVYLLQTSHLSHWVCVIGADSQFSGLFIGSFICFM